MPPVPFFQCLGAVRGELGKHNCQNTWKHPTVKSVLFLFLFFVQAEIMNCGVWPDEALGGCSMLGSSRSFHGGLSLYLTCLIT